MFLTNGYGKAISGKLIPGMKALISVKIKSRFILISVGSIVPLALAAAGNYSEPSNVVSHYISAIFDQPFSLLLLQIIIILMVARIFGKLFARIGQPTVVGEIVAGIALGPSIMGWIMPRFSHLLFPVSSLDNLHILSQTGLILFMFIVGMELDWKILKTKARDAAVISQSSILFPFLLGIGLAFYLFKRFPPTLGEFLPFSLFIALSMSVTAFPVLARIVQERGISRTKTGAMAITSAALNDVTAWSVLAVVIAIVKAGSLVSALNTIGLAITYVLIMILVIRPFLARLGDSHSGKETLNKGVVGLYLLILLSSSLLTEIIGIHALFGAFMAGLVMPENIKFREILSGKIEDIAVVLFLPLFFVSTGLRTEIGLLNEGSLWLIAIVVIFLAVAGKLIGSAIPARLVGQTWRDSLIIGTLMNTRGLMELVVLNIGFDLGLLTPELFVIMVLMAVTTTLLTGPGLKIIDILMPEATVETLKEESVARRFNILLSFGNPESGKSMLRVANSLTKEKETTSSITALHFAPLREMKLYNEEAVEDESFKEIRDEAVLLGVDLKRLFKPSRDLTRGILETANNGEYDFLIIGMGPVTLKGTFLGQLLNLFSKILNPERLVDVAKGREQLFNEAQFSERVRTVISKSRVPVGVFLNNDLTDIETVIVPLFSSDDIETVKLARSIAEGSKSPCIIHDLNMVLKREEFLSNEILNATIGSSVTTTFPRLTSNGGKSIIVVSMARWSEYLTITRESTAPGNFSSYLIVKSRNQVNG